jgi:hypothetical protein
MEIPTKELTKTNGGGFEKVRNIKDNVATFDKHYNYNSFFLNLNLMIYKTFSMQIK